MKCQNCGEENVDGSKFCIKCGSKLEVKTKRTKKVSEDTIIDKENSAVEEVNSKKKFDIVTLKDELLAYLMYIFDFIKKPIKTFKNIDKKLYTTKNTIIFTCITAFLMMFINLIKAMLSVMYVKQYVNFEYKTVCTLKYLGSLNYLSLIFKNFFIYILVILCIALVYYIVSLLFKKSTNYVRMTAITSASIMPYIVIGMILSPLLGLIYSPLGMIVLCIGVIYSILIFINLINDEVKFNDTDSKIYYHLVCLVVIAVISFYSCVSLVTNNVTNGINDLLDIFG